MFNKKLNIGNLSPKFPIIQGGMGIGASLHSLASSVANCGGIGIISGAQIGFKEADFSTNTLQANLRALSKEIKLAREKAPNGILGVNLMVAMKNYSDYVKKAVESKIDLIISGAGLPLDLPDYVKGSNTKLVPIVSSAKAAGLICKFWDKKYNYTPDAIIVEGPLAGGHLGFHTDDLVNPVSLQQIVSEVKEVASAYISKYNKYIPIIAAGGIYNASDIQEALDYGADGVQMATRFVTTHECDAPLSYKQSYIDSTQDSIQIVKSPVGMPGRAITNSLITHYPGNTTCDYRCMHKCSVVDIPYCISKALINAVSDSLEDGLLFCGANAYKATKIESMADIFNEFEQYSSAL